MNKEDIGYAWNFVADLGNGKQFSINGNFANTASIDEMNGEVDKVNAIVNRQQAKAASVSVEQELDQFKQRLAFAKEDFVALDEKNKDKPRISGQEQQQREAAKVHISKLETDIENREKFLSKLKQEAK